MTRAGTITTKRKDTTKSILTAARDLIAEKGVDGFTVTDVGRRAAVNRALVYHYFQDRENLVVQTISHIMSSYEEIEPADGAAGLAQNIRMHIEHPEVARLLFHVLLDGRQLPSLWPRLEHAMASMEQFQGRMADEDSNVDARFIAIALSLLQLSWAFSREELSRHMDLSAEEADEKFISTLSWMTNVGLQALEPSSD